MVIIFEPDDFQKYDDLKSIANRSDSYMVCPTNGAKRDLENWQNGDRTWHLDH